MDAGREVKKRLLLKSRLDCGCARLVRALASHVPWSTQSVSLRFYLYTVTITNWLIMMNPSVFRRKDVIYVALERGRVLARHSFGIMDELFAQSSPMPFFSLERNPAAEVIPKHRSS